MIDTPELTKAEAALIPAGARDSSQSQKAARMLRPLERLSENDVRAVRLTNPRQWVRAPSIAWNHIQGGWHQGCEEAEHYEQGSHIFVRPCWHPFNLVVLIAIFLTVVLPLALPALF